MKNDIHFDKIRYIYLLKKEQTLKNQDRSLWRENRKEATELYSYEIILENQIYYNRKADYIGLVEEYLREKVGKDEARLFVWEFYIIFKKDNNDMRILEKEILEQGIKRLDTFFINPKSTEFSALIADLQADCEFLTFNAEDSYGITLDQFNDSIEKIFFEIQKYMDE